VCVDMGSKDNEYKSRATQIPRNKRECMLNILRKVQNNATVYCPVLLISTRVESLTSLSLGP
jgi:hypothetical protein